MSEDLQLSRAEHLNTITRHIAINQTLTKQLLYPVHQLFHSPVILGLGLMGSERFG